MHALKFQKLSRTRTKECEVKIEKDKMVKIHYTLKDAEGKQLDSSTGHEPLEYLHGNGNLIPGLESELEGKNPGDKFTATIAPEDAYGEYDKQMIVDVPRSQFDSDAAISVGMKFEAHTAGGPMVVTVTKVTDDSVTVDGNHELAGKTLVFDVEVVDVRDATEEEMNPPSCGCGGECGGDCNCDGEDGCGCGDGGCGGECR
jgi:FKBP-type peptidyl-prolyl cis-trans isomerase SlyD